MSGDTDTAFLKARSFRSLDFQRLKQIYLQEVQDKLAKLDRGIRIGSWGQLQGGPSVISNLFASLIALQNGNATWTARQMSTGARRVRGRVVAETLEGISHT